MWNTYDALLTPRSWHSYFCSIDHNHEINHSIIKLGLNIRYFALLFKITIALGDYIISEYWFKILKCELIFEYLPRSATITIQQFTCFTAGVHHINLEELPASI